MMKSKRLPSDRKAFYAVSGEMWPLALELWLSSQSSLGSSSDQQQFHYRLQTARFGLKILKCLATHGNESPAESQAVAELVTRVMEQMPQMVEQCAVMKEKLPSNSAEALEKLVTLHAKVLALLAEEYHACLNHVQERLLQFAAEVVTARKDVPPRFLVKLMIIIKQFSAVARDPYVTQEEEGISPAQLQAKEKDRFDTFEIILLFYPKYSIFENFDF